MNRTNADLRAMSITERAAEYMDLLERLADLLSRPGLVPPAEVDRLLDRLEAIDALDMEELRGGRST